MSDLADMVNENPWIVWVAIGVVLAVAELISLDLVLLMFALGALAAAIASALGAPLWAAILVVGLVSTALLFFVRPPMVRKLHNGPTLMSGHQALVGRIGIVVEPVGEFGGRIQLSGELWSARSTTKAEHFEPGTEVLITAIDGATAVVTMKEN